MPTCYDDKTRTWYCKFYYTDYTGTRKQKLKRGFKLQREAKEWERNFLERQQVDLSITFENFVQLYKEDMKHRLKEYTYLQKQQLIKSKLLPFFGQLPMSQITPATVRKWQNELMTYQDAEGQPYAQTYLKTIYKHLSAIMNYAVRYYNLPENPCRKAGSMGKSQAEEMQFWTTQEFKVFLEKVSDKPQSRAGFLTLYYTGLRIGESLMLAN